MVKKFDGEFPKRHFEHFLDYINIDQDEFKEIIDKSRSKHIWDRVDGEWKLKHKVS